MDGLLIVPIVLPVLAGALLVILAFREQLAEVRNVGSGKKEGKKSAVPENKKGVAPENKRGAVPENKKSVAPENKRGVAPENKKGLAPEKRWKSGKENWPFFYAGIVVTVSVVLALVVSWTGERSVTLFRLVDGLPVMFRVDALGRLFVTVTSVVWLAATVYAVVYMKKEEKQKRYFGFWLLLYGGEQAILLQRKDLTAGDEAEFEPYLREKIATSMMTQGKGEYHEERTAKNL